MTHFWCSRLGKWLRCRKLPCCLYWQHLTMEKLPPHLLLLSLLRPNNISPISAVVADPSFNNVRLNYREESFFDTKLVFYCEEADMAWPQLPIFGHSSLAVRMVPFMWHLYRGKSFWHCSYLSKKGQPAATKVSHFEGRPRVEDEGHTSRAWINDLWWRPRRNKNKKATLGKELISSSKNIE